MRVFTEILRVRITSLQTLPTYKELQLQTEDGLQFTWMQTYLTTSPHPQLPLGKKSQQASSELGSSEVNMRQTHIETLQ